MALSPKTDHTITGNCAGFCRHCQTHHNLGQGGSLQHALALQAELESKGRIDLQVSEEASNALYSLDYLYGPARGQMFGVLEYRAPDNSLGVLRAFSGQYNGQWQVDGWVPPLFDMTLWHETNHETEAKIKDLSGQIELLPTYDPDRAPLIKKRSDMSEQLMKELHALYRLTNFQGVTKKLSDIFMGSGGIPTGTGDCCAPKLLNYAACHKLTPLGISEFFLGRENRSQTRQQGQFYPSCAGKCQPILGFMLCGL